MSILTRTTAVQNEIVRLYCRFIRDGLLFDPVSQPVVEIVDTDGVTVIQTLSPQHETQGVFYVEWFVPTNLPLGQYYDKWTFQWDSSSSIEELTMMFEVHSLENYINFLSQGISYKIGGRALQLMSDLANDFIYEAMHIPVYWEQGMRIQQDVQKKRLKNYYYFVVTSPYPMAYEGDVYAVNGAQYTVFKTLPQSSSSSSSSTNSSSISLSDTSSSSSSSSFSSSSSSLKSFSSSSKSSLSSQSSSSSSSLFSQSSSSSSSFSSESVFSSKSEGEIFEIVLTCVGNLTPPASGTLVKVKGAGSSSLAYSSFAVKMSKFSTIYGFAYKNWNQEPRPIVRLNGRIIDDGWHADYEGRIYFDRMLTPEDHVNVSYNFSYFSKEELLSFLQLGLNMMNSFPPASTAYGNVAGAPLEWGAGILLFAAITALKRLIFGLNFQEKMIIFGTPEMAQNAQAKFQELYASYTELFNAFGKNVKTSKLPGIGQYVTPEYTLPGGRSRFFRYMYKGGSG